MFYHLASFKVDNTQVVQRIILNRFATSFALVLIFLFKSAWFLAIICFYRRQKARTTTVIIQFNLFNISRQTSFSSVSRFTDRIFGSVMFFFNIKESGRTKHLVACTWKAMWKFAKFDFSLELMQI